MRVRAARLPLYILLTKSKKNFLPLFSRPVNRKPPTSTTIGKPLYFGSHRFVGQFVLRDHGSRTELFARRYLCACVAAHLRQRGRIDLNNLEQTAGPIELARSNVAGKDEVRERHRTGPSRSTLQALSWVVPVLLVVIWEALAQAGFVSPQVFPAPSKVVRTAVKLAATDSLLNDLGISLLRAAAGFVIGGSVGFSLGVIVGFSRIAEAVIDRSVQMIRAIPFLAVLPLVIVWLGVGEAEKVFLVALGVTFPIYINTTLGIRQVDPKLIELGRVQGLSALQLVHRIILPGALPSILTGVRYALATAWLALVVAETIGAQSGIGFLAMDAREFLRTDVIVLTIVIYALIGVAADSIARLLERRLLAWHPNYGAAR
jgi:sulfonate transport system permease protein